MNKNYLKFGFFSLIILIVLNFTSPVFSAQNQNKGERFGEKLCSQNRKYWCFTTQKGQSWESIWPNKDEREKIQRLNRMNIELTEGIKIAIPRNLDKTSLTALSPFPSQIKSPGKKQVIVDLNQLAWGAYDSKGKLIKWGPASGGKDWCEDDAEKCKTPTGEFSILFKKEESCESGTYFTHEGEGAPMPYCMFFFKGFAIHGSAEVPGYNASHGCARLFVEDAKWLNEKFVEVPTKENSFQGTEVIVKSS